MGCGSMSQLQNGFNRTPLLLSLSGQTVRPVHPAVSLPVMDRSRLLGWKELTIAATPLPSDEITPPLSTGVSVNLGLDRDPRWILFSLIIVFAGIQTKTLTHACITTRFDSSPWQKDQVLQC